jgi:hypothetical protein
MKFIIFTFFYIVLSSVSLKTTPKFCINCKFAININENSNNRFIKCSLFSINDLLDELVDELDESKFLVTGINSNSILSEKDYIYCSTARQFNHMCGKEGLMYKKKYVRKQNP